MYATIGEKPHKMQHATFALCLVKRLANNLIARQFARFAGVIDARQLLIHHTPRTNI